MQGQALGQGSETRYIRKQGGSCAPLRDGASIRPGLPSINWDIGCQELHGIYSIQFYLTQNRYR